jgi:DNA-binding MarR family transcriptional regulator
MNDISGQAPTVTPPQTNSVMLSLIAAAHAIEARLEQGLAGVGLSSPKHAVLSQLARAGEPLTLSELASRVCCVRSNMTQLVDRLEAEGLVRRIDDSGDRRVVRAAITPLGQEREAAGADQIRRIQSEFAAGLREGDRAALERALAALK